MIFSEHQWWIIGSKLCASVYKHIPLFAMTLVESVWQNGISSQKTNDLQYCTFQVCRYCQQPDDKPSCVDCKTLEDIWVCVICGFVGCGRWRIDFNSVKSSICWLSRPLIYFGMYRYKEGHAFRHWKETEHCYSLHLETQRVWDYAGDTYVHRLNQSKTDGKWTGKNLCCTSNEGDCGCHEDTGFSGVLHSSKVEAVLCSFIIKCHVFATPCLLAYISRG